MKYALTIQYDTDNTVLIGVMGVPTANAVADTIEEAPAAMNLVIVDALQLYIDQGKRVPMPVVNPHNQVWMTEVPEHIVARILLWNAMLDREMQADVAKTLICHPDQLPKKYFNLKRGVSFSSMFIIAKNMGYEYKISLEKMF